MSNLQKSDCVANNLVENVVRKYGHSSINKTKETVCTTLTFHFNTTEPANKEK